MTRAPEIAVVVPVRNESGNIAPLLAEIEAALADLPFECLYVDDGSTDTTGAVLRGARAGRAWLRVLSHDRSCGKSAAVRTAVLAARAPLIVTLDGDGQNDPRAIPRLVAAFHGHGARCGLVAAQRINRRDTGWKRLQSRLANALRRALLRDGTRDVNCGLKCFPRDVYLALPFFDGLHRFLPALVVRDGWEVAHVDVVDRPRLTGISNYGFFDRLWVGIADLAGVVWLLRRRRQVPGVREERGDAG